MSVFRTVTAVCLPMLVVISGAAGEEHQPEPDSPETISEQRIADEGKTFGAFRSSYTAVSRWIERERGGATAWVHLGVRRSEGRTDLIRTVVGPERIREQRIGSLDIGSARIRRVELVPQPASDPGSQASYLIYLTHTGAKLSDGLYRIPAGALEDEDVLERQELAGYGLTDFGRVVDHRAFDVTASGSIVAAHSKDTGSQLLVHDGEQTTRIRELPESETVVEVRAVEQGGGIILAVRTRGETDRAQLRIGNVEVESGQHRFQEYAQLRAEYAGLYEDGGTGPRSPLGMDSAFRDRGLDAVPLDNGKILVVYQYIEQNMTALTQPAAGLHAVVVDPHNDTEPRPYVLQDVATNRFAFSPRISRRSHDALEVVWVVEEHDAEYAGTGVKSDVARARLGAQGEPVGVPENVSSTPRKVSDPAIGDFDRLMWIQSEPGVPAMRPVVVAGEPSAVSHWLIPEHGNSLETLAAAVFAFPIAVLVGLFDATVLWIGGLALIYVFVLALFRFAPDLVRRGGTAVPAAAVLLQLSTYGVAPFSFAVASPTFRQFLVAVLVALVVSALFRRRLLPEGRLVPTDIMRIVWIASAVVAVQLAYPEVAGTLLELGVVSLP